jgi:outer membrane protein assembly factor BamB
MQRVYFLLCLACLFPFAVSAGDWPVWRGPNADGLSPERGWKPSGISKKLWEVNVGKGYSGISIAGGRIYTMGNIKNQDHVFCLDAATGKELWVHKYASKTSGFAGPRATPSVVDGKVYTLSENGLAYCLDAKTGEVKWKTDITSLGPENISWKFSGSPLVVGKVVVLNAGAHGVALDRGTGKKVWVSSGKGGYATPVLSRDGKVLALFSMDSLRMVDLGTGREITSVKWKTKYDVNAADPVFSDVGIFITSGYGKAGAMFVFNGSSLKERWNNKNLKCQFSSPVLYKGHLYGADGHTGKKDAALVCLDAKNGKEKWRESSVGFGSHIIADGKIIHLNDRGVLTICEATPAGFKKIASARVLKGAGKCWTVPTLSGKLLYCRGANGKLVCLDLR